MSITINGATNTLTAASGLTIAGNTAVTGTLSASGNVTFAGATTGILNVNATGTNATRLSLLNDGGQYFFGVDNSTGAGFGGTAYAQVIYAPAGRVVETSIAGTGVITKVSSTGLAVTGNATIEPTAGNAELYLKTTATDWRVISRVSDGSLSLVNDTDSRIPVKIYPNSAEDGLVLTSSGLAVTGRLDLSAASSGQIKFPATQNASADANTLDDYEEGTWTPADASGDGVTYTVTHAKYTKTGRVVFIDAHLAVDANAGGTAMQVGGLPFTCPTFGTLNLDTDQGGVTSTQIGAGTTSFKPSTNAGTLITNAAAAGKFFIVSGSYTI